MSTATAVKPSLTIKRRFNAAPEKVFAAWTDPQKMTRWMGPAKVTYCEATNDLRVGGPGVDAKHATISATMSGFTIVDMNTKHGTRVNAERVRERTLQHDDVIQIGAARFVFREG